jgi:hypothetical protein
MGWVEKAQMAAKLAAEKSAKLAQELNKELQAKAATNENLAMGLDLAKGLKDASVSGIDRASLAFGEYGQTEQGKINGQKVRSVLSAMSKLPILTAIADTFKARNGIPYLYAQFLEQPDNAEVALWLAESLGRTQADLAMFQKLRSVTDPTYFVVFNSIKAATNLGVKPEDQTERKLLQRAFGIAKFNVMRNPNDSNSLHVLGRVYFAMKDMESSLASCKMSVIADRNSPLPWVTIAKTEMATGRLNEAKHAAQKAVDLGNTMGHEILAHIMMLESGENASMSILKEFSAKLDLVKREDRSAYLGVSMDATSMFSDIKNGQLEKINDLVEKVLS